MTSCATATPTLAQNVETNYAKTSAGITATQAAALKPANAGRSTEERLR